MKTTVFMIFLLYSLSMFSQEKSCTDFVTGTFKYDNVAYSDWIITRTATEQIEINNATGLVIHNAVHWQSACEFTLTCTKVSQDAYTQAIGAVFEIIISQTSKGNYTCIVKQNHIQANDMVFKMIKID